MLLFPTYPSLIYGIALTVSFWCWLLFEIWVLSRGRGRPGSTLGTGTGVGDPRSGLRRANQEERLLGPDPAWVGMADVGWMPTRPSGGDRGVIIALIVGITLGLNMPAIAPMFNIHSHFAVYFVLGIVLMWAGILFRLWSVQTLGRFFSTRLTIQDRHELITVGPYRYLRNPSYTGALVTLAGLGLGIGNWLSAAVLFFAAVIAYATRIRVEEGMLLQAFGPRYEEYKKRTWALIPFVW